MNSTLVMNVKCDQFWRSPTLYLYFTVDHGSWFDYTKSWWDVKDVDNVYLVFYEDMKRDLEHEISKLCHFLDKQLPDSVVTKIADHCRFESMKKNPMTNHLDVYSINSKISPLLRKGKMRSK